MSTPEVSRETPLSAVAFKDITGTDSATLERLAAYVELLGSWSRRINLVGASTLGDPWRRHILDSAQLVPLLPAGQPVVVDLGSGAGLPGLVIAIMTESRVHLIESNARKCAFLREAARITSTNLEIHADRIEKLTLVDVGVVTARACAPLEKLFSYAHPLLARRGICLFLKGAGVDRELLTAETEWTMTTSIKESQSDPSGRIVLVKNLSARQTSLP